MYDSAGPRGDVISTKRLQKLCILGTREEGFFQNWLRSARCAGAEVGAEVVKRKSIKIKPGRKKTFIII